jgi:hypothetical protein
MQWPAARRSSRSFWRSAAASCCTAAIGGQGGRGQPQRGTRNKDTPRALGKGQQRHCSLNVFLWPVMLGQGSGVFFVVRHAGARICDNVRVSLGTNSLPSQWLSDSCVQAPQCCVCTQNISNECRKCLLLNERQSRGRDTPPK